MVQGPGLLDPEGVPESAVVLDAHGENGNATVECPFAEFEDHGVVHAHSLWKHHDGGFAAFGVFAEKTFFCFVRIDEFIP